MLPQRTGRGNHSSHRNAWRLDSRRLLNELLESSAGELPDWVSDRWASARALVAAEVSPSLPGRLRPPRVHPPAREWLAACVAGSLCLRAVALGRRAWAGKRNTWHRPCDAGTDRKSHRCSNRARDRSTSRVGPVQRLKRNGTPVHLSYQSR